MTANTANTGIAAMTADKIRKTLRDLGNPDIAEHSQRFFKTGSGEYGEGDQFLGIRVPVLRQHVKEFQDVSIEVTTKVLRSNFHEVRLFALLLLVQKYKKGDDKDKSTVYRLYMDNTKYINNWDLVDSSAPHIVGHYLENRDRRILHKLVKSNNLWERRIAVMSTFHFIRLCDFADTLEFAKALLKDSEDLIHKAVGWMLREIGNREVEVEREFLRTHYKQMPRTMLRYAIEKFPKNERLKYLSGHV